mmetsp:Transcript_27593/g.71582  ORF Transcript_27593/g.71582 Transcript_27593/m.71582 type:complete len:379 (-) Transcript_27593:107-1243(-)
MRFCSRLRSYSCCRCFCFWSLLATASSIIFCAASVSLALPNSMTVTIFLSPSAGGGSALGTDMPAPNALLRSSSDFLIWMRHLVFCEMPMMVAPLAPTTSLTLLAGTWISTSATSSSSDSSRSASLGIFLPSASSFALATRSSSCALLRSASAAFTSGITSLAMNASSGSTSSSSAAAGGGAATGGGCSGAREGGGAPRVGATADCTAPGSSHGIHAASSLGLGAAPACLALKRARISAFLRFFSSSSADSAAPPSCVAGCPIRSWFLGLAPLSLRSRLRLRLRLRSRSRDLLRLRSLRRSRSLPPRSRLSLRLRLLRSRDRLRRRLSRGWRSRLRLRRRRFPSRSLDRLRLRSRPILAAPCAHTCTDASAFSAPLKL